MDRNGTLNVSQEWIDIQKHLMGVNALNESAVRWLSAYHLLENDPHNLNLGMLMLKYEAIFLRFLKSLFHMDIKLSSYDLKDLIVRIGDIVMDFVCLNVSNLSLLQSVHENSLELAE